MSKRILGVDIGGVIIDRVNDKTDTSFFGNNYLQTTAVPDAFNVLKELTEQFDKIHIVSKCGEKIEKKSRHWFEHHEFYEKTGIAPENVFFCKERKDKAPICAQLSITHFIDDKLEVLSYLTTVPRLYLFQGREEEIKKYRDFLPAVRQIDSWNKFLDSIRRSG